MKTLKNLILEKPSFDFPGTNGHSLHLDQALNHSGWALMDTQTGIVREAGVISLKAHPRLNCPSWRAGALVEGLADHLSYEFLTKLRAMTVEGVDQRIFRGKGGQPIRNNTAVLLRLAEYCGALMSEFSSFLPGGKAAVNKQLIYKVRSFMRLPSNEEILDYARAAAPKAYDWYSFPTKVSKERAYDAATAIAHAKCFYAILKTDTSLYHEMAGYEIGGK